MSNPRVIIQRHEAAAAVRPADFLGGEIFAAYRDACGAAGATYDADAKRSLCPVPQLPRLIENLERIGLRPVVAPDIATELAAHAEQIRQDMAAASTHVATIEAELTPRGLALFQHQREGIAWLAPRRRGALFCSMGTGKTVQALLAAPHGAPTAVVCPASVKLNWRNEALRWRPDARVRVLQGRAKWEWPMPGEIVIGNYEVLPELDRAGRRKSIPERYGLPAPGTVVIGDELHYCKSSVAKRSQSMRAVTAAALAVDGRAWGLTGTPLVNRPQELWNVLKCLQLAEEAFGTWKEFRALLGGYQGRWGTKWDGEIDASVPTRLQRVSLYRKREDVLDLPPKMRVSIEVPGKFPPDVRKLLDEVLDALAEQGVDLDEAAELIDLTKVSGAAFEQLSKARAALATAKIPSMLELVEACEEEGEPLIVFSAHRAPIDVLAKRRGWATITGSQKAEERQESVRAFQAGELRGIACTIKAGGIGITLTRAAHEIFVDLAWTPADNNQAEDRACRIGQTRSVLVRRLVADHELDRRIEQVLRAKQEIIDATVEPSAVRRVRQNHTADLEANADRLERAIGVRPSPAPSERPAAVEAWVRHAILELHAQDAFSDTDRPLASTLVAPCVAGQPLALALWKVALTILPKYTAIVGAMPHAV